MNKKALFTVLIILGLFCANVTLALAQDNYTYTPQVPKENPNLQGYAIYVPAGINVNAVLSTEINSQNAIVGQNINAILIEDFIYNGITVASAGSVIEGTVILNKKANYGNKNAQTQIKFTTIRTPYNNIIPISASIMTNDSTGVLKGASTKDSVLDYAKSTAVGAGSGAIMGTAMGALSGGSVGRGAIYGTAIGAGMGLIKSGAQKGENVIIPANSQISIYFDQPITMGAQ